MKSLKLGLALITSLALMLSVCLPVLAGDEDTVDLEVEVIPPPEDDGRAPTYSMESNLFGETETFYTDRKGVVQRTVSTTSQDGMLTITIPKGTTALGENGKRLRELEASINETPPEPPEDTHVIGLAYDFGPDGATFDPPLIFTWNYDPNAFPEGVAWLVIAYYDKEAGEWVELPCTVDPVNHTITASVAHFTTFAIIGTVPPMPPLPPPVEPEPPEIVPVEPEPVVEEPEPEIEEPEVVEPEEPEVIEPEVEEPIEPVKPDITILKKPSYLWAYTLAGVLVATAAGLFWLWRRRRRHY